MSTSLIQVNLDGYDNQYIRRKRHPFNDKRLERVRISYEKCLVEHPTTCIELAARTDAEAFSFRRFLQNKRVAIDELIYVSCQVLKKSVKRGRLVVYGDTTSYNLKYKQHKLKDRNKLGCVDDNKTPGFHAHVNIVADRHNGNILGLSDIQLWSRPQVSIGKTSTERDKIPFENKEASKWSRGVKNSLRLLKEAKHTLFIFDSEADSYENFEHILKNKAAGFIIRSHYNRRINYNGERIFLEQILEKSPSLGQYTMKLPKLIERYKPGKPIKRTKRLAKMEVKCIEVNVSPPYRFRKKKPIKLRLVEAREITTKIPKGEKRIVWRLWTTEKIENFEQAREIIKLYTWRWNIEQLFRLTKKKGFGLESTNLETFESILKQTIMILKSASVILQLIKARENDDSQNIKEVFEAHEIKVLKKLNEHLQGRTIILQNKNNKNKLSWAAWIIARLGGWKGYTSRGHPGPITFKRGLAEFLIYVKASEIL